VDIILKVKSKSDESVQNIRRPLNGRMVLGRGPDSAVPLDAPGISREHLEVQVEDSALSLVDVSSNGTWLNGARMPPRRKCKARESDLIELPGYEIHLQLAGAPAGQGTPGPLLAGDPATAMRSASLAPGPRTPPLMTNVSGVELFVIVVTLMSAGLLAFYLTS